MKSRLPFHRQEHSYSCTVACLRTIFAHHSIEIDEATLRQKCKTKEFGTYARDVLACAREFAFMASIEYLSLEQLQLLINRGVFPIVYINMFPTSQIPYVHTVIVEQYESDRLLLIDPNVGPWEIQALDFLQAWEIHANMAIILQMEKI